MTSRRAHLYVYTAGTLLVLVGSLLPWVRGFRPIWGWDISVLWPVTGDLGAIHLPPSASTVTFATALALAMPIMRGRPPLAGPLSAALGGFVTAIAVLFLLRAITYEQVLPLHAGLFLTLAGSLAVAGAALVYGD